MCKTELFITKLPRKKTSLVGMLLGGVISLSFIFVRIPDECANIICYQKIISIILAGMLRYTICFVWTTIYIFFSELFPTVVRSLALGATSTAGTLGSFSAPFLVQACTGKINPMIILGFISLAGAV